MISFASGMWKCVCVCICACMAEDGRQEERDVGRQQQLVEIHSVREAQGDTHTHADRERERGQQKMPPWPAAWKGDSGA